MAIATRASRSRAALEAIERAASDELSPQQAVEAIVHQVATAIDADAFFATATDPETGLPLSAGVTWNLPDSLCAPFWEHEFFVPDYNKFTHLTAANPIGDLRIATGDKLSRSARSRAFRAFGDLEDELRATLTAGGRAWGLLHLNRRVGSLPFTDEDVTFLRAAAPLAGAALRQALLTKSAHIDPARGPGVLILDRSGAVVATTREAEEWFKELTAAESMRYHPAEIPLALLLMLTGVPTQPEANPRRTRLRTPGGMWLVAHASHLVDSDQTAIVIEPAKASEIAPIIVEAYGLSRREAEITRLVARGVGTDQIATTLFLSRHTVRDHLKAAFEKVGVSSRGELSSKLFAEHYLPSLQDAVDGSRQDVDASLQLAQDRR